MPTLSRIGLWQADGCLVLTRAIANYERTLISGWSRYDRYVYRETGRYERSGTAAACSLFTSPRLNCTACHNGFDLSDHSFQNIGQYMDYADTGRERITLDPADNGKFKVPTLRNVALTAPYMHDGAMATLEEVIDHFASGGLPHPNKSPEMTNFVLSVADKGRSDRLPACPHRRTFHRPSTMNRDARHLLPTACSTLGRSRCCRH